MADPIFSPDGKWMWTGSEWIPAPPSSASGANSTTNLQDSMMSGNVNVEQKSDDASSVINLKDSAMSGDINITQNNAEDIATAMVQALERMGFSGQSSPAELKPSQEKEVEQVLEMSEQLAGHGIEVDPWTEITLGNAAKLAGRTNSAQQHYIRALESFRKNGDRLGEATSLNNLGNIAQTRGDLAEAERLHRESLAIKREIGNRQGEAASLNNLGIIAQQRGNVPLAELLHLEGLAITREIGDKQGEANSLVNLALIAQSRKKRKEQRRLNSEAVKIWREIGVPVPQWYIDNGY
jgi:tetratricopeptide (TPR) repeat protein